MLTLSDPTGGVQRLELIVGAHTTPNESLTVPMNVRSGTIEAKFRPIRAGDVIDISATGQYKVGNLFYDKSIDPRGYPDGDARSYNFDTEPYKSAPHGSGLVMVGFSDAKAGYNVNPCARFVSRSFGPLIVGINDSDPTNNTGDATFVVKVSPPTAAEWLGGATESCPVQ